MHYWYNVSWYGHCEKQHGGFFKKTIKNRDLSSGPVARIPNAGGLGSIPGQETRFYMLQRKVCMPPLKNLALCDEDGGVCATYSWNRSEYK